MACALQLGSERQRAALSALAVGNNVQGQPLGVARTSGYRNIGTRCLRNYRDRSDLFHWGATLLGKSQRTVEKLYRRRHIYSTVDMICAKWEYDAQPNPNSIKSE